MITQEEHDVLIQGGFYEEEKNFYVKRRITITYGEYGGAGLINRYKMAFSVSPSGRSLIRVYVLSDPPLTTVSLLNGIKLLKKEVIDSLEITLDALKKV